MGADLPASELVMSELWWAAAVSPGICGTPDGRLTMAVTTCELYLDISVSSWSLVCGGKGKGLVKVKA